jgi:DNA-binding NtrC family response regulator
MPSVLIVDDLISIHEMLEAVIQPTGFSTAFATDGEKALARYKGEKFDMVLADIDMKPMDGITLLKQLKQYDPNSVTIIMTAYASTESAVQALKFGAFDYLQKPFRVDELIATLRRGLEFREIQAQRALVTTGAGLRPDDIEGRLIGKSTLIKKLIQQVKKLAAVRSPVLLVGENGSGKTSVAEILHGVTGAGQAQFVRVDCALSSEQNFRAGLLGQNGEGGPWIREAKGGTLFLQHPQCLTLPVQKELVSVLRNTSHGFRLVCATTEDLEKMVDEGRFNEELFYRVASLPIQMPPLRDRRDDIPMLVKHFAASASNPHVDPNLIEFTGDAMTVLSAYHWPGNIAELFQLVSKLASTTETRIMTSQQLPLRLRDLKHWPKMADFLEGQEKQYLDRVLHACRGDKAAAAHVLGIDASKLG